MQQIKQESNILKDRKLGRGISSLLGSNINSDIIQQSPGSNIRDTVKMIKMDKIIAGIYQPRTYFDEGKLSSLSKSIAKNGVIQPIIVRRADLAKDLYEIIAGERRFRASKLAGLPEIPAIIKEVSNNTALEFAIIENVQRSDLSAIEEAKGYKQLIDEFGYTQERVSVKLGKSRSYVANLIRLLSLPDEVQKMVEDGSLSSSHARSLIGKSNALELAKDIVNNSLSVREVEDLEENYAPNLNNRSEIKPTKEELNSEEKLIKKEYLKTLESNLSPMIGNLKVKASYDLSKKKGKVTIFYNEFEEIENIINKLDLESK